MAWGDGMSGRSESGNLRNFRHMSDEKLIRTLYEVRSEDSDGEALEALEKEAQTRGVDIYADTETLVRKALEKLEDMRAVPGSQIDEVIDLLRAAVDA